MAHKITLGSRPKTFTRPVTFDLHEGGEGVITMTYRYRTRTEFGAFVDEIAENAGVAPPKSASEEDMVFSLRAVLEASGAKNAEYILQIADGWDVAGHVFDLAGVRQLCDELPGAALKIMLNYREAIVEGKLGN